MPRARRRRARAVRRKPWNFQNAGTVNSDPDANEDGQFVAFASFDNLDGDPDDFDVIEADEEAVSGVSSTDIFVQDFVNSRIVRVSVDEHGELLRHEGSLAQSSSPAISADGQQVAFITNGAGVDDDLNGQTGEPNDVYLKRIDRTAEQPGNGELILVSEHPVTHLAAGGVSGTVDMSADGRFVVFRTSTDLGDGDEGIDVYLRDLTRDAASGTTLVSFGADTARAVVGVTAISGDGRFVAYDGGSFDDPDVFIWDRLQPAEEPVALSTLIGRPTGASDPTLSHDGDFIAFTTDEALDTDDVDDAALPGANDVYRVNTETGEVVWVSVPAVEDAGCLDEEQEPSGSSQPSVDASGRFVTFSSPDRLLCGDYNSDPQDRGSIEFGFDVFVKDVRSGELALASVTQEGDPAERNTAGDLGGSVEPSISADSDVVAFVTDAPNLLESAVLVGRDEGPANTERDDAFITFEVGDSVVRADVVFDDLRVLAGMEEDDRIRGQKGRAELIDGQGGGDRLFGWKGPDQVFGGEGDDRVFGNRQSDLVEGNDGDDRVDGGRGADRLKGGLGPDTLIGDRGADQLFGGPGDDHMRGNRGQDRLEGNSGNDIYIGGPDPDHFVFDRLSALDEFGVPGLGQDEIEDFRRGDKIALLNFNFQSFEDDVQPLLDERGGDTVLDLSGLFPNPPDTITIQNRVDLEAGDFVFD